MYHIWSSDAALCREGIDNEFLFLVKVSNTDYYSNELICNIKTEYYNNELICNIPFQGSIDLLISVYKKEFKNLGGYLVNMSQVYPYMNSHIVVLFQYQSCLQTFKMFCLLCPTGC